MLSVLAVALLVQSPQYGYTPGYATGSLPTCDTSHVGRVVMDETEGAYKRCDGDSWESVGGSAGGVLESGLIVLSLTTCPSGYAEESSLNGKFALGTLDANADVTTTGGSDSITSVLNHTHPVTDPGHNHAQNSHNHTQDAHQHGMAEGTTDGSGTFMDRSNAAAATTAVTDAATATNQAATATNQANTTGVTTTNPAGGVASIDNRPAFVRVIFCRKT